MRTLSPLLLPLVLLLGCTAVDSGPGPGDEPDEPGTVGNGKADGSSCATAFHGRTVHICGFSQIAPGVYRGARPSALGLRDLAALGVRVDLDLEKVADVVSAERASAAAAGLTFAHQPMSYLLPPSDGQVDDVLAILDDGARRPVFLHCKLGNDRTGMVAAIYRVETQGWDPARAWQEALDLGFHRVWVGLSHYYEERTGYDD